MVNFKVYVFSHLFRNGGFLQPSCTTQPSRVSGHRVCVFVSIQAIM